MRALMAGVLASAFAISGCGSSSFRPAAGVEAYQFDESRVPMGVVYHYVKSNLDGSTPERISLYISATDTLEAYRWREPAPQMTSYVKATMDWARWSAIRLESRRKTKGGGDTLNAVAEYVPVARALSIEFSDNTRHTVTIEHLPFHFYQFDLASLNVAFRQLKDPKAPFQVGLDVHPESPCDFGMNI